MVTLRKKVTLLQFFHDNVAELLCMCGFRRTFALAIKKQTALQQQTNKQINQQTKVKKGTKS